MRRGSLERIFVKQRLEYLEYLTGFETDNAYDVYHVDAMGNRQKVFYMEEQSSAFQKLCWCATAASAAGGIAGIGSADRAPARAAARAVPSTCASPPFTTANCS